MLYRKFERINKNVSLLGLGTMRLPSQPDGNVDETQAVAMIRHAIDQGINYIDTAYTYHGGESEVILGKALKDGYRQKALIADKLPTWLVEKPEDVGRMFEEQLQRLDTDCIDLYLVHNVDREEWKIAQENDVLPQLEQFRQEGKIRYIGFSYHDELDFFKEVVDAFDWDMCQIQLNYTDASFQAGLEGLRYASSKGMGVVIMEPLKGGRLTDLVPPAVQELWDSASVKRSPAEWAFKWVASQPGVTTILSGMSNMDQLQDNLKIFAKADLPDLTRSEEELIDQVAAFYKNAIKYPCTECRYCMPCPAGVFIPRVMRFYNDWLVYEKNPSLQHEYLTWLDEGEHASSCVKCGRCEEQCPQHLPVRQIMDEIVAAFGK